MLLRRVCFIRLLFWCNHYGAYVVAHAFMPKKVSPSNWGFLHIDIDRNTNSICINYNFPIIILQTYCRVLTYMVRAAVCYASLICIFFIDTGCIRFGLVRRVVLIRLFFMWSLFGPCGRARVHVTKFPPSNCSFSDFEIDRNQIASVLILIYQL